MPLMPPEMIEKFVEDAGGWAKLMQTPYRPDTTLIDMIRNAEPWPHLVYYCGDTGKVDYLDPTHYRWKSWPDGPSDCTWIVPGTGQ